MKGATLIPYYKDLVFQYLSTCRDLFKKGIYHPYFYVDVEKFKSETSKLIKSLSE